MTKQLIVTRTESRLLDLTAEQEISLKKERDEWRAANPIKSEFKIAIENLRNKRNRLLIETDWMANSDLTISNDWKTYRQALRDLPSGLDTVEKVNAKEFPTKPSE